MHNIYIGFDKREASAWYLCEHSIVTRTNPADVKIHSLRLTNTPMLNRPIEHRTNSNGVPQMWCPISNAPMSTAFAISRFAIPFLQPEGGVALGMDSDMICQADIRELFSFADPRYAVQVVKHKHEAVEKYHDAGQLQSNYDRKNWSSLILWNLDHPGNKRLTVKDLNTWPGRDLHAFKWLQDDEIGPLPQTWNYLIGVNRPADLRSQKMVHYTNGHPGWPGWIPQPTDYIFNEEMNDYKNHKPKSQTENY